MVTADQRFGAFGAFDRLTSNGEPRVDGARAGARCGPQPPASTVARVVQLLVECDPDLIADDMLRLEQLIRLVDLVCLEPLNP
jgi:hypothetical protein